MTRLSENSFIWYGSFFNSSPLKLGSLTFKIFNPFSLRLVQAWIKSLSSFFSTSIELSSNPVHSKFYFKTTSEILLQSFLFYRLGNCHVSCSLSFSPLLNIVKFARKKLIKMLFFLPVDRKETGEKNNKTKKYCLSCLTFCGCRKRNCFRNSH